jgi:hypothetical protein
MHSQNIPRFSLVSQLPNQEKDPGESTSVLSENHVSNLTSTQSLQINSFISRLNENYQFLKRKRDLEIESQELKQKHERILLQIQQEIVENVLENNFDKAEQLKRYMKTLREAFSQSKETEVIEISDDDEKDFKIVLEKPSDSKSVPSMPSLNLPVAPSKTATQMITLPAVNILPPGKLIIHVVASRDAIPQNNPFVTVIYKAKSECGKFPFNQKRRCIFKTEHCHYICYLSDNKERGRNSYLIYLNNVLLKKFDMTIIKRNLVVSTIKQVNQIIKALEEVKKF